MSNLRSRVLLEEERRKGKKIRFKKDFATYRTYVVDMCSYIMLKHGITWHFRDCRTDIECIVRTFHPFIGEAVCQYHIAHEKELMEEVCENLNRDIGHDIDRKAIEDCVRRFAEKIFKGENFVKEFFVFCSFLIEVTRFFVQYGVPEQMAMIVDSIETVYELFLVRRFAVFGGWHALRRYAEQYLAYNLKIYD